MKVMFVGAGPGDPDLLTVKAKKILESCRCCIYAGSLVSPEVVALAPDSAELYNSAEMDLEEITAVYEKCRDDGIDVVRLHTGDPAIYGAILEQMERLEELDIDYEVIPGVSSFQAAAAALKCELTVPEKAQAVILTRTGGRTPVPEEQELDRLGRSGATLCIFLSVQKMKDVAALLIPHYGGDAPAAVVYRASWPDQQTVRGTLNDIHEKVAAAGIKKTAIIVVGPALTTGNPASRLYDKNFSHEYRKAGK